MSSFFLIRPFIHALPPEHAHNLGLFALKHSLMPPSRITPDACLAQEVWGLNFSHPVGLAAGFDKNAEAIPALHRQGFSFVEAGTVTPLAQQGNPQPRMFRLKKDHAVINRLGFNNNGLEKFVSNLATRKKTGIAGANIGKNKDTEEAAGDYLKGLTRVYPHADYVTINISSPNTQGLRALQKRESLMQLLSALVKEREALVALYQRRVPLFLKIAPDLDLPDLEDVAEVAIEMKIDALVISNTTIKRPRTLQSGLHGQQGGLSGAPLFPISTEMLARMYQLTGGRIPLVGVGGISSAEDAYKKIRAGATLVQLYTAIVYQGFGVVKDIVRGLPELLARDGFSHIKDAIGADHR